MQFSKEEEFEIDRLIKEFPVNHTLSSVRLLFLGVHVEHDAFAKLRNQRLELCLVYIASVRDFLLGSVSTLVDDLKSETEG